MTDPRITLKKSAVPPEDSPKCEKCGLEITTGMMAAFCQNADQCEFWPHSDGTPQGDGGELFMAKAWMRSACEQIGLQIEDRKRLERAISDERADAERYRWLRSEDTATNPLYYPFWQEFTVKLCREEAMDALIDSAMTSRQVAPPDRRPPYPFCCHPDKCIATGRCERRVGGELHCCAD